MKRGLTQNYLLCILGKKGKVSAFGIEKYIGLTAAGVLELLQDGGKESIGDKITGYVDTLLVGLMMIYHLRRRGFLVGNQAM